MAYIIGAGDQDPERKAAASARTAVPARKDRPTMAGKKKGYACWSCGGRMSKARLFCKRCKKTRPAAVKTQTAVLNKSYGGNPRPVAALAVTKAALPMCLNPACGKRGASSAQNCCARCGTAYSQLASARADKAFRDLQASRPGTPESWHRKAMAQHDPQAREACFAEARKAARLRGTDTSATVSLLVKASGAGSVREAWLREADPHAREVLRAALYGNYGGWTA